MAETKVYTNNAWEVAGDGNPEVSAGRTVGNVSRAAGWHTLMSKTLTKGKYNLQGQFTFNCSQAGDVCILISKNGSTGETVYARQACFFTAADKIGVNCSAILNENDFDGNDTMNWTFVLWTSKAITQQGMSFVHSPIK